MIDVKVCGEEIELDTLNGYYCLDDIFKMIGKPDGKSPRYWFSQLDQRPPHGSIAFTRTKTWANQIKVYSYCAWLCENFNDVMHKVKDTGDKALALTISTSIIHKL